MGCVLHCTDKDLRQLSSPSITVRGAAGEKFAQVIVQDRLSLKVSQSAFAKKQQGLDLPPMRNPSRPLILVEVKTSGKDKPFAEYLKTGYGQKQASVGWVREVGQRMLRQEPENRTIGRAILDNLRAPMLGVHINPETKEANIYIRRDDEGHDWHLVVGAIPLNHYVRGG